MDNLENDLTAALRLKHLREHEAKMKEEIKHTPGTCAKCGGTGVIGNGPTAYNPQPCDCKCIQKEITILKTLSIGDAGYPFDVAIEVEYKEFENEIVVTYCVEDNSPYDNPPEKWYKKIEETVTDYFYDQNPSKKVTFKL